jgi:hypothetical protein
MSTIVHNTSCVGNVDNSSQVMFRTYLATARSKSQAGSVSEQHTRGAGCHGIASEYGTGGQGGGHNYVVMK